MRGLLIIVGLALLGVSLWWGTSRRDPLPIRTEPERPSRTVAPAADAAGGGTPDRDIGGLPASQFWIRRDFFLPATDMPTVAASDATYVSPSEDVFGVVINDEARAYPIRFLAYHHVVNDRVADVPIAVTY